jgi:hypothetical protein
MCRLARFGFCDEALNAGHRLFPVEQDVVEAFWLGACGRLREQHGAAEQ